VRGGAALVDAVRRPVVPFPDCHHEGDWILMRKQAD
jgi:hypothetical protein